MTGLLLGVVLNHLGMMTLLMSMRINWVRLHVQDLTNVAYAGYRASHHDMQVYSLTSTNTSPNINGQVHTRQHFEIAPQVFSTLEHVDLLRQYHDSLVKGTRSQSLQFKLM